MAALVQSLYKLVRHQSNFVSAGDIMPLIVNSGCNKCTHGAGWGALIPY